MSLQNDILLEIDELTGRLSSIRINWPDTEVRVKHSIFQMRELMAEPTESRIYNIIEDLYDLKKYLGDIYKLDPKELSRDFRPAMELIDRLLGPAETKH
jgi:hypothetical protein